MYCFNYKMFIGTKQTTLAVYQLARMSTLPNRLHTRGYRHSNNNKNGTGFSHNRFSFYLNAVQKQKNITGKNSTQGGEKKHRGINISQSMGAQCDLDNSIRALTGMKNKRMGPGMHFRFLGFLCLCAWESGDKRIRR